MFPISRETLTFSEVADYWSREIHASPDELLDLLISAWWLGEIVAYGPRPTRLELLKSIFTHRARDKGLVFTFDPTEESSTRYNEDGTIEVDITPRICVPSNDPNTWTEPECESAFRSLAAVSIVDNRPDLLFTFGWLGVNQGNFMNWMRLRRYHRPTFWEIAVPKSTLPSVEDSVVAGSSLTKTPKPATDGMIHDAIKAVYEKKKEAGQKPPNIRQIGTPVENYLVAPVIENDGNF
jgi:hypothetical protein